MGPLLGILALGLWGCSRSVSTPTPSVTGAENFLTQPSVQTRYPLPQAVAWAPVANLLQIQGSGFLLMVAGAASGTPSTLIPSVSVGGIAVPASAVGYVGKETLRATLGPFSLPTIAVTAQVTVTNPDGKSATGGSLTLYEHLPPVLQGMVPAAVCSGGATASVVGAEFWTLPTAAYLSSGGQDLALTNLGNLATDAFTALLPATLPAGSYVLTVTEPDGQSATLAAALTVGAGSCPSVSSIDPPFGWTGGRTVVTLTGSGFDAGAVAYLQSATSPSLQCALVNVAYQSSKSLTGALPAGCPIGDYFVVVVDASGAQTPPSGAIFRVDPLPPPKVDSIVPNSNSGNPAQLVVYGDHFASGATVEVLTCPTCPPTALSGAVVTTTMITLPFPSALGAGNYVVRVVNPDGSYYDYASLVILNASANPTSCSNTCGSSCPTIASLRTARAGLGVVSAMDDLGNHFLYALGGDDRSGNDFDSVEVGTVDLYGNLTAWSVDPNRMGARRTGLGAAAVPFAAFPQPPTTTYVYAAGGSNPSGVLSSIERARVLTFDTQPTSVVAAATTVAGGNLDTGSWIYRVAALDAVDGEGLPSDWTGVHTNGSQNAVSLSWLPPPRTAPSAGAMAVQGYAVYRTPSAGGAAGQLGYLAGVTNVLSFTDVGDALQSPNRAPLFPGALGVWSSAGSMASPREGLTLALGRVFSTAPPYPPPATNVLYFLGGTYDGTHPVTATVEFATARLDGSLSGPTTSASNFATPRFRHGSISVTPIEAPDFGSTSTADLLYVIDGTPDGTTALSNDVQFAPVGPTGDAGPWRANACGAGQGNFQFKGEGFVGAVLDDYALLWGGRNGTSYPTSIWQTSTSGKIASASNPSLCSGSTAVGGCSLVHARYQLGLGIVGGFLYSVGGYNPTDGVLASVEYMVF